MTKSQGLFGTITFSPDGRWLATEDVDAILLWDMMDLEKEPVALKCEEGFSSFAFSPDNKWAAIGCYDKAVHLWSMKSLSSEPILLRGHESSIYELTFSPDSQWLASGNDDSNTAENLNSLVCLWDMNDPSATPVILRLQHVIDDELSIVFSPDSQSVITGNNPIRIWKLGHESLLESACHIVGRNFTRAEWILYFPAEEDRKTCEQWPLEPEVTATP